MISRTPFVVKTATRSVVTQPLGCEQEVKVSVLQRPGAGPPHSSRRPLSVPGAASAAICVTTDASIPRRLSWPLVIASQPDSPIVTGSSGADA